MPCVLLWNVFATEMSNEKKNKCITSKQRNLIGVMISSVQLLSHVRFFATPWTQHARPPCPSPTPGVDPNSRPSSQWCHPAISSSGVPFSSCPQSLPASVFSNESIPRMRWPKDWRFSFSIIPSKEIPGLISFRMDWLDLLAVQGTLKSLLQHPQFKSINSSVLRFLHSPTLTSIHDHRLWFSLD